MDIIQAETQLYDRFPYIPESVINMTPLKTLTQSYLAWTSVTYS